MYTDVCLNSGWGKFSLQQYLSADLVEKWVCWVTKTKQELSDLDDDSTDIFKSNIIEHYCNRPASVPAADNICLAQFATYHTMDYRKENIETIDAQPEVLTDDIIEIQHSNSNSSDSSYLPKRYHSFDE